MGSRRVSQHEYITYNCIRLSAAFQFSRFVCFICCYSINAPLSSLILSIYLSISISLSLSLSLSVSVYLYFCVRVFFITHFVIFQSLHLRCGFSHLFFNFFFQKSSLDFHCVCFSFRSADFLFQNLIYTVIELWTNALIAMC